MMFLWFPFMFLIPLVILWALRSDEGMAGCGLGHMGHVQPPKADASDPMDIARVRLARGEITTSEYEEIRRAIS